MSTVLSEPSQAKPLQRLLQRMPLTLKAVAIGLFCGLVVWMALDRFQTRALEGIFAQHLEHRLDEAVIEGRIRFDQHVKRQSRTIKLMAANQRVVEYVSKTHWKDADEDYVKRHRRTPEWVPPISFWRGLLGLGDLLLLDNNGRIRERYQIGRGASHQALYQPDNLRLEQTLQQAYITSLDDAPVLMAAARIVTSQEERKGYLMLIVPLDSNFMRASQNSLPTSGAVVALLGGDERRVLASSAPQLLAANVLIDDVRKEFLLSGQSFFDYGSSDLRLQFITLVPTTQVEEINTEVLALERKQRIIAAFAFVMVFTLLMFLISGRISALMERISNFSERALGGETQAPSKGDQLLQLESQFGQLTREVLDAREAMRQHHESELRESEAFKGAILEAALDCIVSVDASGQIIEFNPAAEEILGYERATAMGQVLADLIFSDELRNTFNRNLELYLDSWAGDLVGMRLEADIRRADGSVFPSEFAVTPTLVGEETIFTLYLQDISQRKEAEREIQSLANFARENPNPVLRVSSSGSLLFANRGSQPLLDHWNVSTGETLPKDVREYIDAVISKEKDTEIEIKCGGLIFSLVISSPTEFSYVNIYGRDITEARKAEETSQRHQNELIHVSRLSTMGEMAAGLAHELNQPLSAIVNYARGCVRRMQGEKTDMAQIRGALEHVSTQAERAGDIIRSLRNLVEKREPIRENADIAEIIRQSVEFLRFDMHRQSVQVELNLLSKPLIIKVDVVQIEQVLLNLFRNAMEAMQDTGRADRRIVVNTSIERSWVRVDVMDFGTGVAAERRDEIFHPFCSDKAGGMGMGLAISTTIVEAHGGRLWFEDNLDGGTIFSMEFPKVSKENENER